MSNHLRQHKINDISANIEVMRFNYRCYYNIFILLPIDAWAMMKEVYYFK